MHGECMVHSVGICTMHGKCMDHLKYFILQGSLPFTVDEWTTGLGDCKRLEEDAEVPLFCYPLISFIWALDSDMWFSRFIAPPPLFGAMEPRHWNITRKFNELLMRTVPPSGTVKLKQPPKFNTKPKIFYSIQDLWDVIYKLPWIDYDGGTSFFPAKNKHLKEMYSIIKTPLSTQPWYFIQYLHFLIKACLLRQWKRFNKNLDLVYLNTWNFINKDKYHLALKYYKVGISPLLQYSLVNEPIIKVFHWIQWCLVPIAGATGVFFMPVVKGKICVIDMGC